MLEVNREAGHVLLDPDAMASEPQRLAQLVLQAALHAASANRLRCCSGSSIKDT
ncbi:MAG: hypothetical protein KY433_09550 [Actinobacteria bacterium]|nr:hypothetical protein [Actinomycetota bacterium]